MSSNCPRELVTVAGRLEVAAARVIRTRPRGWSLPATVTRPRMMPPGAGDAAAACAAVAVGLAGGGCPAKRCGQRADAVIANTSKIRMARV